MPDANTIITYSIPILLMLGGVATILYLRHIARKEMRERDSHPPAE